MKEGQPVTLRPDTAEIRKAVKLSNMFRDRYRIDFSPAEGHILCIKNWDENVRKWDLVASKRETGYGGEQKLHRLTGAMVKCHCALSNETIYIDIDEFLFPESAIMPLDSPGPILKFSPIPKSHI
jgi:hypothetical protein